MRVSKKEEEDMSGFSFEAELAKEDAVKDAEYEAWKTAKIAEIGAWRFKTVVCRHWLRNACMNGDRCEYMHQHDRDRMPECHNGQDCNKPDCPFKHSGPRGKKECLFYKQGFCVHGPNCKFNHTKYTAEALPKYGDYSTLFDGKEHERPENKSLGDLVDPKELRHGYQGGGFVQPGTGMSMMMPSGANGVVVPRREFPKNINYRTSICRMFAEGFCKHADRCHFAHGEEKLRTRQQNADEYNLPFQGGASGPPGQGMPMGGVGGGTGGAAGGGYNHPNPNHGGSFNQNYAPPVALLAAPKSDLPDKQGGSYRYFVVRTPDPAEKDGDPDYDNIMVSLFKGVWCTSGDRAEALSSAFRNCDHVFLFFTVGGSNLFQGCARMASEVDVVDTAGGAKAPVGFGDSDEAIFTVQWLKLCELEHRAVEHLSFDGAGGAAAGTKRYVPQAQDFEELPARTGSVVLELMWNEDSFEVDYEDVDIDAARFEGWGAHGIVDPAKGLAGDGSGIGSLLPGVEKGSEGALAQEIWRVEGPGFIVGCDGEMFGECFQRSLFGMPELYKEQTRFIHKGTTLLLYRLDTKQLFGIFAAGSECMTLLEPNAFAPDATTTTLYPVQVRFRVVAEVPPMEEDEIAGLLGGGQPVRRVEPDVMQRLVDRMVQAGGGATTVAMKNGLAIPGFDADPADGKFRERLFIGDEITDDRRFRGAQRVAGPNGQNLIKIVNEVGTRALRLSLVGRGAGQSPGGEEGPDGLALTIEANDAMTFSKALNKCTDLIDHIRDKHAQFVKEGVGVGVGDGGGRGAAAAAAVNGAAEDGFRGGGGRGGGGSGRNGPGGLQDGGRGGPPARGGDFQRDRGSPRGSPRGGIPPGGGFHGGRRGGPGPGPGGPGSGPGPGGLGGAVVRSPVAPRNARPGDWPCPRCGAHNFAQRMQCFKCKCERPQSGPPRGRGGGGGGGGRGRGGMSPRGGGGGGGGFDRRDGGSDRRDGGFHDRHGGDRKRPRSRSRDRKDRHRDHRSRSRSYRGSRRGDDRDGRSRDRDRRDRDGGSRSRHRDRSRDRKRSRRR